MLCLLRLVEYTLNTDSMMTPRSNFDLVIVQLLTLAFLCKKQDTENNTVTQITTIHLWHLAAVLIFLEDPRELLLYSDNSKPQSINHTIFAETMQR